MLIPIVYLYSYIMFLSWVSDNQSFNFGWWHVSCQFWQKENQFYF